MTYSSWCACIAETNQKTLLLSPGPILVCLAFAFQNFTSWKERHCWNVKTFHRFHDHRHVPYGYYSHSSAGAQSYPRSSKYPLHVGGGGDDHQRMAGRWPNHWPTLKHHGVWYIGNSHATQEPLVPGQCPTPRPYSGHQVIKVGLAT